MIRWLESYEKSALGIAIENSNWLFPTAETIHLLALTVLIGSLMATALGFLSRFNAGTLADILGGFSRYTWTALGVMLASGVALFFSSALKYYRSPSFRVKMLALALAILVQAVAYRRLSGRVANIPEPLATRCVPLLLILLWLGVGLAGRAIGFLG